MGHQDQQDGHDARAGRHNGAVGRRSEWPRIEPATPTPLVVPATVTNVLSTRGPDDGNWAQWRGPAGLDVSTDTSFVTEWTPSSNIKWRTEIPGRGHSSPIVWRRSRLSDDVDQRRTGARAKGAGASRLRSAARVPASGRDRCRLQAHADRCSRSRRRPAASPGSGRPTTGRWLDDRHRQYHVRLIDGRDRWRSWCSRSSSPPACTRTISTARRCGRCPWAASSKAGLGPGTSPVLYGGLIILQCDQEMGDGSFIVALERRRARKCGAQSRKTRRSWATPLIVRVGDHDELSRQAPRSSSRYHPTTGKERWQTHGDREPSDSEPGRRPRPRRA